jgi:hypothetical protein
VQKTIKEDTFLKGVFFVYEAWLMPKDLLPVKNIVLCSFQKLATLKKPRIFIRTKNNLIMEQNQNSSLFQLNLDAQNSYTLRSAASWAKVLGIVSLIIAILCIIGGILIQQAISQNMGQFDSYQYKKSGLSASSFGNMGLAVYVIMGLLYGVSGLFALNAGNKINSGLKTNNMETLNSGFAGARNFFALWAILMILFLLLILIGLMGSL